MQEIVSFCDHHYERTNAQGNPQRVLAEGFRIGISGLWKRIDLCQDCKVELLGPLEVVLQRHGQAVSDVAPELLAPITRRSPIYSDEAYQRKIEAMNAPRQCLWCPEVVPDGYARLKTHIAKHGFTDFDAAYGHKCPICLVDADRLSSHIGRGHMVKLSDAFEWAYYGGNAAARHVADDRRTRGQFVGAPAQTEGCIEMVEQAREAWVSAHGEPS